MDARFPSCRSGCPLLGYGIVVVDQARKGREGENGVGGVLDINAWP